MKAWQVHEFGPPDVMKFEELPRPAPGPGEVLVKVAAAGVGSALPQPLPLTPGSDLSGEIVEVRPGVSGLSAAEPVYGVTNSRFIGAYAEFAGTLTAAAEREDRARRRDRLRVQAWNKSRRQSDSYFGPARDSVRPLS